MIDLAGLLSDVRFALRMLRRNTSVTVIAVLAMVLAIGIAGTMFSVVNTVLIQPLPFAEPERLVAVWQIETTNAELWRPAAAGNYADWRRASQSFEQVGAAVNISKTFTAFDEPDTPLMQQVSAGYFATLGARPALGRTFTRDEDVPGARAVAVLSHELWQRRFGGDQRILGQTIELDGQPYEIIGVMSAGFDNPIFGLTDRPQVWLPLALAESGLDRRGNNHYVVARLKSGVTLDQAGQELRQISEEMRKQNPETNRSVEALVTPLKESIVRGVRPAVWLLLGAVLLLLLIASSNVAHLLLTRSVAREREFAVRQALGAGAARLLRQLVVESLLLMMLCAVPGLLLTVWGSRLVRSLIPLGLNIPRFDFQIDGNVVLFLLLISVLPGLVLGVVPALYAWRVNLVTGLTGTARATGGRGSRRLQHFLVIAETALALALLIGAGLMTRSYRNLQHLDQGFAPENLLTFRVSTRGAAYRDSAARQQFFKEIHDRLATIPGVSSVGAAQSHPFYPQFALTTLRVEGQADPEPGREPRVTALLTTPGYFTTMKMPLLQGRLLSQEDREDAPPVAVISARMARQLWGDENAVGKRLAVGNSRNVFRQVVGIVGDVRTDSFPPDPQPTVYLPLEQDAAPAGIAYVLRTSGRPLTFIEAARKEVWSVDRGMPVFLIRSMDDIVNGMDWRSQFMMSLLAIFSVLSVLLAVTGIYAALSYVVSQQTREIGIRMALGARKGDVLRLVIRQGMTLALIGSAIGLAISAALTQLIRHLLFSVSALDPITYLLLPMLFLLVALLASYLPARRATRVEPMSALRAD